MASGYQLLTDEQRTEMDNLTERSTHSASMRFSELDAIHLSEYENLCARLQAEYLKEVQVD